MACGDLRQHQIHGTPLLRALQLAQLPNSDPSCWLEVAKVLQCTARNLQSYQGRRLGPRRGTHVGAITDGQRSTVNVS